MEPRGAFFREIHKNSWLKRLTAEGRRITIGPKKSDRSWVVFCVHDDTDALLEGYAEPRLAPSHNPEWTISLQNTQHISHSLVHNEKEFEFVITLDNSVVRFHAASWETMQEWVEVLRQKLREMKILSPRENLYTKMPEGRIPLLPTRDPTSPLPATPPVPAAIVPGVECVITTATTTTTTTTSTSTSSTTTNSNTTPTPSRNSFESLSSTLSSSSSGNSDIISTNIQTSAVIHQETTGHQQRYPQISSHISRQTELHSNSSQNLLNIENNNSIESLSTIEIENDIKENILIDKNLETESVNKVINTSIISSENSIRVDITASTNSETAGSNPFHYVVSKSKTILRPEVTPSTAFNKVITSTSIDTAINTDKYEPCTSNSNNSEINNCSDSTTNIMIIQVSNPEPSVSASSSSSLSSLSVNNNQNRGDIFKFPPPDNLTDSLENFKSNVHIIPSCLDDVTQYSSPLKVSNKNNNLDLTQQQQVTTVVKVSNNIIDNSNPQTLLSTTTKQQISDDSGILNQISKWSNAPEKIILSTNTSGVTNISVGNETTAATAAGATSNISVHYDKVFLASSSPSTPNTPPAIINFPQPQQQQRSLLKNPSSSSSSLSSTSVVPSPPSNIKSKKIKTNQEALLIPKNNKNIALHHRVITAGPSNSNSSISLSVKKQNSPQIERKKPKPIERGRENVPPPPPVIRRPLLTRGATEAVITARPSRIDLIKRNVAVIDSSSSVTINNNTTNSHETNNERTKSESLDRRRRSSSVSETDRRNNIDLNQQQQQPQQQNHYHQAPSHASQQQIQRLQPFRFAHENKLTNVSKKLTLREQQVMQLRREIMHPGGVRLQLRRKDCLGSIAWVDIFGTVWIAGWKQKEHPMLYNALHIGDQLISIAGNTIKTAAEANKIIRNSNTLFIEILIRRIPFGRVYAIRREIEGQCLGLIRDGNSATIVDVVPNSLSARHGLTPKAKTCDGLSLTFWVLTEINGRPLNLFCKDNEIHDRLNSVGRDISILVQPLDLITKLRKQLKAIRSFKDYIIQ